jgi:hypothetical protein
VLTAGAVVFVAPLWAVAHGTARARECVASVIAPRGPALPDCRREMPWFILPSRVPWTAKRARLVAEELATRARVASYEDAAIGRPDAAGLERAAEELTAAARVLRAGSQRTTLEDLGRAVGTPDLGRSAMLAGDRRTLVAQAESWDDWSVRLRALEAALTEADLERATAIARHYADFDPRDEDLRLAVAAMLCMRGDPLRGGALLSTVQTERAHDRHEAWARNWGEVRAVIVACASKARKPPPPRPEGGKGGAGDLLEARAVLRLKLLARDAAGDSEALHDAAVDTIELLKRGPLAPGVRARLLAALVASAHTMAPALVASLASPRVADGEGPLLLPAQTWSALDWLDEPRRFSPLPSREALRAAADRLRYLAANTTIAAEERSALENAATATSIEAARAFALAGDATTAVEVVDSAGARSRLSEPARAFARSSAWYVAAEWARALAEIEREPEDLKEDPALGVAWHLQKAELLAAAGRREEAARAVVLADEAALRVGDRALRVRALWTRLALAPPSATLRAPPPSPLRGERPWPWVGEIGSSRSWLTRGAESGAALAQAHGWWDAALQAAPEEQRAMRYQAALEHRGDTPRAVPAYLALAAALLPHGEGDVEVWLDAFSATSARSATMRAYAWSRAAAARFRGDGEAASRWIARYRALMEAAASPDDAELAASLGI